jgi:alpha-L-rhamnosidase
MKRLTILLLIVIATAHIAVAKPKSPSLWVGSLKVEQMSSPMGIDARHPRLSWVIGSTQNDVRQTAYEIIVASSAEKLAKDEGDIWSSGKVESDSSVLVGYKGAPLKSNQRCYWKVRVYTTKGNTPWSAPSMWSSSGKSPTLPAGSMPVKS